MLRVEYLFDFICDNVKLSWISNGFYKCKKMTTDTLQEDSTHYKYSQRQTLAMVIPLLLGIWHILQFLFKSVILI